MFYVKGDCHGDYSILYQALQKMKGARKLQPQDTVILLGDHGLNYYYKSDPQQDQLYRDQIGAISRVLNINFLLIHGNHDGYRPENCPELYEETEYCGAAAWHFKDDNLSRVYYAKCGEIYNLDGEKAVVLDGAYSVDKPFRVRVEQGWNWFSDEQPTGKMQRYAEKKLKESGWKVDYVLSHTCPYSVVPREILLKGYNENDIDNSTEQWLDVIYQQLDFKHWYCGHFHNELNLTDKVTLLQHNILALGEKLKK